MASPRTESLRVTRARARAQDPDPSSTGEALRLLEGLSSSPGSVQSLDVRLGEEAFARAWAEGQAMTLEQAVEYALSDEAEA